MFRHEGLIVIYTLFSPLSVIQVQEQMDKESVLMHAQFLSDIQVLRPNRLYPTRLFCPWDFPCKKY